jgi:hypothetical protein
MKANRRTKPEKEESRRLISDRYGCCHAIGYDGNCSLERDTTFEGWKKTEDIRKKMEGGGKELRRC